MERWFDASNYDKNDKKALLMGINKTLIALFKDKLEKKIMEEFCALRAKKCSYLIDDDSGKKKSKGIKKIVIKRRLMFENYRDLLFNNKAILKS